MTKGKAKSFTTRERSGTDDILSHERNWSELPLDILHLFSKKLPDISDFIRFRVVCKKWQLSAPLTDPPPQLPWLLERLQNPEVDRKIPIMRFYCLSSSKVHTITCPGSCRAYLEGPAYHFLLASHFGNSERCLLNPLTHDQIHLPFMVNVHGFVADYIGPDPIEGGDVVVISAYQSPNFMAFWRPKADDWVYVDGVGNRINAFYRGQYFGNDEETGITSVALRSTTHKSHVHRS